VGITLREGVLLQRLHEAVKLAEAGQPLPPEWTERATVVGAGPRKVDMVILTAGLLAKATNPRIDPMLIKIDVGERAYSIRVVADRVLAPSATIYGFDLGSTSPNPSNSSTFLRPPSIDQVVGVRHPKSLEYLKDALRRVDELDADGALRALAALLRVRMAVMASKRQVAPPTAALSLPEMLAAVTKFINDDPQFGARGQAFAAAAYDLAFQEVRTRKVHDPSRHWPGDVQVFYRRSPILAVEVKQRTVAASEVLGFTANLRANGFDRGVYAALHPRQGPMPPDLVQQAWEQNRVLLTWLEGTAAVLLGALAWSPRPLRYVLAEFPKRMLKRLQDLEVDEDGQEEWVALFRAALVAEPEISEGRLFDDDPGRF
jgi:hypothetical protein